MATADLLAKVERAVSQMSGDDAEAQEVLPLGGSTEADTSPVATDVPFAVALLALGSVRGVGTKGLRSLVSRLGEDLGLVWALPEEKLSRLLGECKLQSPAGLAASIVEDRAPLVRTGRDHVDRLIESRVHILSPSTLPSKLRDIPGRPEWLFVDGAPEALEGVHLGVVGSRTPSEQGLRATEAAARIAAAYPVTIVSGLADGIDAVAHWASMNEGMRNVAFLGHGIGTVFPATTAAVRKRITESGGAVATEYLPWEHYRKEQFVQRNRLQAALSDQILVVDARSNGGTAHTARFALQYKKQILALTWPGVLDLALELKRANRCESFEIFTQDGARALDRAIRSAADRNGLETNALTLVIRELRRESRMRNIRIDDLDRLRKIIDRVPPVSDETI